MGSRPKVIRLSEASPPPDLDAEEEPPEKKPESVLIGGIMEKGFSTSRPEKVSVPQPRVTPFPVARHRSEGPYWAPLSKMPVQSTTMGYGEEESSIASAGFAEPLSRNRDRTSQVASQWRSNRRAHSSESSQHNSLAVGCASTIELDRERSESIPSERRLTHNGLASRMDVGEPLDSTDFESGAVLDKSMAKISWRSQIVNKDLNGRSPDEAQSTEFVVPECSQSAPESIVEKNGSKEQFGSANGIGDQTVVQKFQESVVPGKGSQVDHGSVLAISNRGMPETVSKEIDMENRKALFSMSAASVAEAQAELSEKLRPELLELLRKRGLEKERKRLAESRAAASSKSSEGFDPGMKNEALGNSKSHTENLPEAENNTTFVGGIRENLLNQTSVGQGESANLEESVSQSAAAGESPQNVERTESNVETKTTSSDLWTSRVEAVRTMRFDLDGTVVSFEPAKEQSATVPPSSSEAAAVMNQENVLSAVERDMLRTEGNPAGSGYTLKEALGLVRSTVPGQRSVALRLIASVLDKAIHGLQMQQLKPVLLADLKGLVDWQAVWAYALGPEAELVLTLRLALDDGHSTVVAACARAIQALFSYSANESFFDSLEGLWPGDNFVYTAPIFRMKTKHDEGFIGSGRWKYNVKRSEMFPFSGTSSQEQVEEEGKDTVGEDGHVANKDVVAGLLRMGLLPRLRYILEVDKLIVADDALLCVLISVARHSPAAAAAVMSCPRLIDTVLQRFVLRHGIESEESWSCQVKVVRLLKVHILLKAISSFKVVPVLSQASRSNCKHFEKCGVLEAFLRPLLQQPSAESLSGHESLRGFYATTIETIRFWGVCLSYRMGLSFFTDCYPTLCIWLLPLSEEEILSGGPDASFTLAMESYCLLENIARTLPMLHDNLSPTVALAVQLGGTKWSWSVAMTMLNTALKWLSPDRISAVHMVLKRFLQANGEQVDHGIALRTRTRKILGLLGSVLHFLATVCEKIVSEKDLECGLNDPSNFSLPWLPTFVPHLGLALARCGLLNDALEEKQSNLTNRRLEKTPTLLDFMRFCLWKRDNDSMLAALNCQHALVRVSSMVDKLVFINKPKDTPTATDQPVADAILDQGLLVSAEDQLRRLVGVTGKTMTSRSSLIEMSSRGGPAPGVGVGWGSLSGGVWSKDVMVAQASARLNLELISVLSVKRSLTSSEDKLSGSDDARRSGSEGALFDPMWRINTGLAVAALATPPDMDLVGRGCSLTIFHPDSLSLLIEKIHPCVHSWSSGNPHGVHRGYGHGHSMFDSAHLSKILVQHLQTFWLAIKRKKTPDDGVSHAFPGISNGSLKSKLSTVREEDSSEGDDITPHSLTKEFAGQRLPLPSHWFLSPLVTDTTRATMTDSGVTVAELEEVVTAGLAFFLGLELLKAGISAIGPPIPLVRKIHSLSCVFVTGGDVFLQPLARDLIGALQDVIGCQLGEELPHVLEPSDGQSGEQRDLPVHGDQSASSTADRSSQVATPVYSGQKLDFEGSIDPSYTTYAESIAEQFVASSYGDFVFGRQVALHLSTAAPDIIRLATWRVLTDARVLELLPPLSKCCGQPSRYLNPIEVDQKMIEAYVSAWTSGALDKAATRNSLPFRLALHHLGGYIFDKEDLGDDSLMQKKLARTLVRSTLRRSERQAMLIRLLVGITADQPSVNVKEQVKTRLAFLTEACEGDAMLLAEIQRVTSVL